MAEEPPTTGMSAVQVLASEHKTPPSTGISTAVPTEHGVSDVTNRISAASAPSHGNNNTGAMPYTNNPYNNNNYPGNPYSNYNPGFNPYSNSNTYYGGGYNSYSRDYNNSNFKPAVAYNNSGGGNPNSSPGEVADASVVDSALQAALRDSRERVALLRLEQVMIDFMNAPEGYLEVGGPYNSVVVSPNTSSKRFQSAASVTDTGGRQTSFQRCLLHRLADRFGIVRESGTILDGSIRLIKQKESKVPKKLLLDHLDAINNNSNNEASGDAEALASGMEDLKVSQPTTGKDKSKKKMKIMKRNSSVDSNSGQTKTTPKSRKSKNFTDKEKAYAEARARIFAADEAEAANNSTAPSEAPAQSEPASIAAPPPSEAPAPPTNSATMTTPSSVQNSSNAGLKITKRMSSGSLMESNNDETLPPAAASSGVSKATWRNRKEEENDPDFQRGAGLQTLVPVVAAPTYNVPIAGNAYYYQAGGTYGQPHYYGEHPGRGVTGIAAGRGGRGFVAPRGYGYPQQQQYHTGGNVNVVNNGEATNVHCMEEFPALR